MEAARRAGVGCGSGKRTGRCSSFGGRFWPNSTIEVRSAGMSASETGVLPPRKRGLRSRQNQARQGNKVDGFGRWPRYSAGSTPGLGVPVGDLAPRSDTRHGPGPACASSGSAAVAARASDPRSRLRQQPAAPMAERVGHRAHHSDPTSSAPRYAPGWKKAASLPPALDRRAYICLVGLVPKAAGPAGTSALHLRRLLSPRLRDAHAAPGFEMSSRREACRAAWRLRPTTRSRRPPPVPEPTGVRWPSP